MNGNLGCRNARSECSGEQFLVCKALSTGRVIVGSRLRSRRRFFGPRGCCRVNARGRKNQEQACHAYYARVARNWREGLLPAQKNAPANLVFLRTQAEILRYLPDNSIDTLLLLNPEPKVAKSFLDLMQRESLFVKIKKGSSQIVILPYSREMGIMACGGFEFEHDTDWSRGLGFIFESKLPFKPGPAVLWGVDLRAVSAYTGNSTQRNVYICGEKSEGQAVAPTGQDNSHNRQ